VFHDELLSSDEHAKFHDAYQRFSDAVSASLRTFLWAMEEYRAAVYGERCDIHAVPHTGEPGR
jgi:hypothetical protein